MRVRSVVEGSEWESIGCGCTRLVRVPCATPRGSDADWVTREDAETKVPIDFLLTGGVPGDGVMRGMTFPDPKDVAIEIAGKRYLDLATLVGMKVASAMTTRDRWRDWDDVIRLIRSNELGEHFADGLHPYVREKYRELWRIAQMPPAMES